MTNKDHPPSELPLPCVLDDDDIDRLLERLRAVTYPFQPFLSSQSAEVSLSHAHPQMLI